MLNLSSSYTNNIKNKWFYGVAILFKPFDILCQINKYCETNYRFNLLIIEGMYLFLLLLSDRYWPEFWLLKLERRNYITKGVHILAHCCIIFTSNNLIEVTTKFSLRNVTSARLFDNWRMDNNCLIIERHLLIVSSLCESQTSTLSLFIPDRVDFRD